MVNTFKRQKSPVEGPTVFIVDDDPDLRESMTWLIESAGFHVRTYASAEAFLDAHNPELPGCIVLDVHMPGVDGLDLQKELASRGDGRPIIMITAFGDVPRAVGALKAGAMDFVEKPFSDQAILESIRHAIKTDQALRQARSNRKRISELLALLTPRERQVMELVVAGKSNKIVAAELGLSPKTVEIHRARVMEKLQAGSLAELVRLRLELDQQPAVESGRSDVEGS